MITTIQSMVYIYIYQYITIIFPLLLVYTIFKHQFIPSLLGLCELLETILLNTKQFRSVPRDQNVIPEARNTIRPTLAATRPGVQATWRRRKTNGGRHGYHGNEVAKNWRLHKTMAIQYMVNIPIVNG